MKNFNLGVLVTLLVLLVLLLVWPWQFASALDTIIYWCYGLLGIKKGLFN